MRLCAVTVTCLTSTGLPALVLTCWVSMKSPPLCIHLVSTPLQRELHASSHISGCSMRNSGGEHKTNQSGEAVEILLDSQAPLMRVYSKDLHEACLLNWAS